MNAMTEVQDPLLFTDNAANKVKQLIEEEGNAELKLRVFEKGIQEPKIKQTVDLPS